MNTTPWVGAAVALIASACMTSAQDLDSRAERGLDRALKTLDKLEADLPPYESGERTYSDSVGERASDKLQGLETKLADLPPEHPRVVAVHQRVAALRQRLARLVEERGSLGARSGLDGKAAGKLNHVATLLENLGTELGHYGVDGKYTYNDRVAERFQKKLEQAQGKLEELPAENTLVAMLHAQLEQLREQLGSMGQDLEQAQAQAQARAAERERLLSAPNYPADLARAQALYDAIVHCGLIDYQAGYLRRPFRTLDLEVAEGYADQFAVVRAQWPQLVETYAPLRGGRPNDMLFVLSDGQRLFPAYVARFEAFVSGAPAHLEPLQAEVGRLAQEAAAAKDHRAFVHPESPLNRALAQVRHVAQLVQRIGGDGGLAQGAARLEAEVQAAMAELAEAIVEENRAPADAYPGADRAELEAFVREQWSQHFAQERVLAVRFPQDAFRRVVAWRWDAQRKEPYKVDHSELWTRVVVAAEDGEAILYPVVVRRMHLEGDRLTLAWDRPDPVPPTLRMRAENLD